MWVRCKECRGKGKVILAYSDMKTDCSACKGKGGFRVPKGKEICPDCGGSRRVEVPISCILSSLRAMEVCKRCNATGFIDKNPTSK